MVAVVTDPTSRMTIRNANQLVDNVGHICAGDLVVRRGGASEPTIQNMSATLDQFSLSGRVAIVTGASSGLGERFARALADAGATVVAAARRLDRLESLARKVKEVVPIRADLLLADDRAALVAAALERFGRIDVLVNNAGGGSATTALTEPIEDFRRNLELNLVATFDLCQRVAPHMIEAGRGSIINIASVLGLGSSWPIPNGSYTASKGAVVNLTRELGCQWARRGVRVNALAPGFFPSEAMQSMIDDEGATKMMRANCPIGRYGEVHELDGALLFLASDASTYCTGQILAIDGGWTAR